MTSLTQDRMTVAIAIALPCALAVWLLATATSAVPSTYMFVALLAVAVAFIGFTIWNNGQASGSIAQVIHEADTAVGVNAAGPTADTSASRWYWWVSRGDSLAYTGRVRALLVFSIVVTGAMLFYMWLA
jgi:hypothetical protein